MKYYALKTDWLKKFVIAVFIKTFQKTTYKF